MIKKILTYALAGAMVLSTMSFPAFAAEAELPEATDRVITLSDTLTISEDTTIDLAGNTITSASAEGEQTFLSTLIKVDSGTLTITDSVGGGKLVGGIRTNTKAWNGSYSTIEVSAGAALVIDGAVVEGSKGINTKYGATAVKNNGGTVEVKNGSIVKGGDCEKNVADAAAAEALYCKYQGNAGTGIVSYNGIVTVSDSTIKGGDGLSAEGNAQKYISGGPNQADGGKAITASRATVNISDSAVSGGNSDLRNAGDAVESTFSSSVTIAESIITGGSCLVSGNGYGIAGTAVVVMQHDSAYEGKLEVTCSTLTGGNTDDSFIGSAIDITTSVKVIDVAIESATLESGSGSGSPYPVIKGFVDKGDQINVTLSDVTLNAQTAGAGLVAIPVFAEGTLNVAADSENKTLETDNVKTKTGVTVSGTDDEIVVNKVVAAIGNTYYTALNEAVEAAEAGDVIDLLNGTVKLADTKQMNVKKDITITNGTIDISGVNIMSNALWLVSGATLTFDNVNLIGDGYDSAFGIVYLVTTNAGVKFIDSTVDLKADGKSGGFVKGDGYMGTVLIDNSDITLVATNRGFITTDITVQNDSHISISGDKALEGYGIENAMNMCALTIKDTSTLSIKDCYEYGIKIGDMPINVQDTAKITATGSTIADIAHRAPSNVGVVTVDSGAVIEADNIKLNDNSLIQGEGAVISKADKIAVQFEKASDDNTLYNIILVAADNKTINRLTSADLTFKLSAEKMGYEIVKYGNVNCTANGTNRYLFHLNGVTAPDETGKAIVIGQIKFDGYGALIFEVDDAAATNVVNAAKILDNIVDTFVVGGAEGKGTLTINESPDGVIETTIAVPTSTLTVNVAFNNAISDNAAAYQAMKATITGGDLTEDIVVDFGSDKDTKLADNVYRFTAELTENTAYTVTITGEGYRTARYTVNMTEDKTLNFWNNAKDSAAEVEEGNTNSKKTVTYLAGDIVKDNNINIYDLSAVVSYFGTIADTNAYSKYAKYDLNRDGKIDSKDVAIVLVSWGK